MKLLRAIAIDERPTRPTREIIPLLDRLDAAHVQLAAALTWQESVGAAITLATFNRQLWDAGKKAGVRIWPETLKE